MDYPQGRWTTKPKPTGVRSALWRDCYGQIEVVLKQGSARVLRLLGKREHMQRLVNASHIWIATGSLTKVEYAVGKHENA